MQHEQVLFRSSCIVGKHPKKIKIVGVLMFLEATGQKLHKKFSGVTSSISTDHDSHSHATISNRYIPFHHFSREQNLIYLKMKKMTHIELYFISLLNEIADQNQNQSIKNNHFLPLN
ncbi:hypothetical protein GDO81_005003 [Engystomops pustulosus]|uniref:Uncharacterized protein n=1 Tax=Engystomops pustulosus TaxID=76066 RepID=A0AAV7CJX7_ENGPU|nr:hypothetical protein GDO81_005003 [Engystomops pustulosus]